MRIDRPQRLAVTAVPGALLKRLHALAERARMRPERDPDHLAMVRQLPCLRCGLEPCGEASHVRRQSAAHGKRGGIGKKPADRWTLPLDSACHRLDYDSLHNIGEDFFWYLLGIDPLFAAERLYHRRGDLVAMRAEALRIIAERSRKC